MAVGSANILFNPELFRKRVTKFLMDSDSYSGTVSMMADEITDIALNSVALNSVVQERKDTHLVIKRDDIDKYLKDDDAMAFSVLLNKINSGRIRDGKQLNEYYVVNKDEPYAGIIQSAILQGEKKKLEKGETS